MILFRCECGSSYCVDDSCAGTAVTCDRCNAELAVPAQSDPEVFLIFRSGDPETGVPMAQEQLSALLAAGKVQSSDLVWHGDNWRPIGEVFGEGGPAKPQLRLKKRDGGLLPQEEADEIEELSPVQKLDMDVAPPPAAATGTKGFAGRRTEAAPDGAPAAEAKKRSPTRRAIYWGIQVVLLIIAVYYGYKWGFGPLLSHRRNQPTHLFVHNHEDVKYSAVLGWRRLKSDLLPKSFCDFEIFVGMREKQALTLTPQAGGEKYKVKVPLRPGAVILLNCKQKGEYGVFDVAKVKTRDINDVLGRLAREIAGNDSPDSAFNVHSAIRDIGKEAFRTTSRELFYDSAQYQFSRVAMVGLDELTKKDNEGTPRPVLVCPPELRIEFANGNGFFSELQPRKVDNRLSLPAREFKLNKGRTIKVGSNQQIEMRGDDKRVGLVLRIQTYHEKAKPDPNKDEVLTFVGTWTYQANLDLTAAKKRWAWAWDYAGTATHKERGLMRLVLKVDKDGKESEKVGEVMR